MGKPRRLKLTGQHWAWLNALVALGTWGVLIGIFTPAVYGIVFQQPIIGVWATLTVLGVVIAVIAVFWSVSLNAVHRTLAVSIEIIGICIASVGPLVYLAAQIILFTIPTGDGSSRIALTALAYFAVSMLVYRLVVLFPRFLKEARDTSKDV